MDRFIETQIKSFNNKKYDMSNQDEILKNIQN